MKPTAAIVALSLTSVALFAGCAAPHAPYVAPSGSDASRPQPDAPRITAEDIDRLVGRPWIGTLTYLDYTSKKQTTIDSSITVTRKAATSATWTVGVGYSKEPHADSSEDVSLSADGTRFGDEVIVARTTLPDGVVFITECDGEDDNRPARFRFEHTITASEYSRRKLVKFNGTGEFFERHIYRWRR